MNISCLLCFVFALLFFVLCTLCCQFLWIVYLWLPLRYSLTFICPVSCVHYVASFYELSICDCPSVFSNVLLHLITRFNVFYDRDFILMAIAYLLILHTNDSFNMAEKKMIHISIFFFLVLFLCWYSTPPIQLYLLHTLTHT